MHPEEVSLDTSKHNTPGLYINLFHTLRKWEKILGCIGWRGGTLMKYPRQFETLFSMTHGAWRHPEETPRQVEKKNFLRRRGPGGTLKKYPRQVET